MLCSTIKRSGPFLGFPKSLRCFWRRGVAAPQIAANDDARCQGHGAKPGSDAYVSCRMNIDNQRAAADNANRAIVGQYLLTHR
jgi:hypothetical protein